MDSKVTIFGHLEATQYRYEPAIVEREKFEAVQRLMAENGQTNRNAAETIKHAYVLSRGVLRCGRCGSEMEGRSGTGRLGTRYYYYVCKNKECGLRVAAEEIEAAVLERIQHLAGDGVLIKRLTEETNSRLLKQRLLWKNGGNPF